MEAGVIKRAKYVMRKNETLLTKPENDCKLLSTKLENITDMSNPELYKDNVLLIHTVECKAKVSESEVTITGMIIKQSDFV